MINCLSPKLSMEAIKSYLVITVVGCSAASEALCTYEDFDDFNIVDLTKVKTTLKCEVA